jgi:hypothetical protein
MHRIPPWRLPVTNHSGRCRGSTRLPLRGQCRAGAGRVTGFPFQHDAGRRRVTRKRGGVYGKAWRGVLLRWVRRGGHAGGRASCRVGSGRASTVEPLSRNAKRKRRDTKHNAQRVACRVLGSGLRAFRPARATERRSPKVESRPWTRDRRQATGDRRTTQFARGPGYGCVSPIRRCTSSDAHTCAATRDAIRTTTRPVRRRPPLRPAPRPSWW